MRMKYYIEKILSHYVQNIHEARIIHDRRAILQKDSDSSYDIKQIREKSKATLYKETN